MRVAYITPSSRDFEILFARHKKIRGGTIDVIKQINGPLYYQRGSGFLSFISNVIKRTIPFIRGVILPRAADLGRDLIHDYANKRNMRESAKTHGISALRDVGKKIVAGGIRKRKSKTKKKKNNNNAKRKNIGATCHSPDIFNKY